MSTILDQFALKFKYNILFKCIRSDVLLNNQGLILLLERCPKAFGMYIYVIKDLHVTPGDYTWSS